MEYHIFMVVTMGCDAVKVEVFLSMGIKAYRANRGTVPLIFNLCSTRWL
jgi:hypothetical protein